MSTRNTDLTEAVEHLPPGAILVLQGVAWEDYERLVIDLMDRPGVRVSYDQGRLEIMSPLKEHEYLKEFAARVVYALCDELDLNVEPCGSTTWKRKRDLKGAEPDASFYLRNAERMIGKSEIDLDVDPPPDLVIEIDMTNESLGKFSTYSTFGVPEIWRYDGKHRQAVLYELRGQSYVEIPASLSFSILTAEVLTGSMELARTQGQKPALSDFRRWIRSRDQ